MHTRVHVHAIFMDHATHQVGLCSASLSGDENPMALEMLALYG